VGEAEGDAGVLPTTSLSSALPGAGTSMLAQRLTTSLPAMTLDEAIETTRMHRVAGLTGDRTALVTTRPCRAPHYPISDVGRIGGGDVLLPGDVSRTHQGVQWLSNAFPMWFHLTILFTDD
jgi:predicted ATPase with chaperone activity